jgi:hypothetical protein
VKILRRLVQKTLDFFEIFLGIIWKRPNVVLPGLGILVFES